MSGLTLIEKLMKKLTTDEMNRLTVEEFREAEKLPLTVVLDNVRSQNNIGSIFRTSDAFRIEKICLCGICSTPPHRDIHKTALGAEESVAWQYYETSAECLRALKADGYTLYAIEQVDDSIKLGCSDTQMFGCSDRLAIIFGNEVEGVDETLLSVDPETGLSLCDGCLEIPQYGTKHSLNVSYAAAIVLWELSKAMRNQKA